MRALIMLVSITIPTVLGVVTINEFIKAANLWRDRIDLQYGEVEHGTRR